MYVQQQRRKAPVFLTQVVYSFSVCTTTTCTLSAKEIFLDLLAVWGPEHPYSVVRSSIRLSLMNTQWHWQQSHHNDVTCFIPEVWPQPLLGVSVLLYYGTGHRRSKTGNGTPLTAIGSCTGDSSRHHVCCCQHQRKLWKRFISRV